MWSESRWGRTGSAQEEGDHQHNTASVSSCDIGPGESENRLCVMMLMPGIKRSVHFSSTMTRSHGFRVTGCLGETASIVTGTPGLSAACPISPTAHERPLQITLS